MGEIDDAAREEMKSERKFTYYTYDSTCLVENDEEPPSPLNQEALLLSLNNCKNVRDDPDRTDKYDA